jgi:putative transposase
MRLYPAHPGNPRRYIEGESPHLWRGTYSLRGRAHYGICRCTGIKSGSFSQDARGRWSCNLVVEYLPKPHGGNAAVVGIDLGLKDGMTLSMGAKVENFRVFAKYEADLATAQRANKARRVATIHAKIANTHKDFLHKETTKTVDAFGLICVANVSGRRLQATNGKSAADASTGMSRNMLRYTAMARAATFVDVSESSPLRPVPTAVRSEAHKVPQVSK